MNWLVFAIVGSIAQLIDGALGMGFGLTSSTLLVTVGASAAVASAAVHAAEIGTTLASGLSHWHAENVDKKVMIRLAIPGSIGAFLGANFLSNIDLSKSKIFISTILLMLGFVLLYRNIFKSEKVNLVEVNNPNFLTFLGFSGGFIDASGGCYTTTIFRKSIAHYATTNIGRNLDDLLKLRFKNLDIKTQQLMSDLTDNLVRFDSVDWDRALLS